MTNAYRIVVDAGRLGRFALDSASEPTDEEVKSFVDKLNFTESSLRELTVEKHTTEVGNFFDVWNRRPTTTRTTVATHKVYK